VRADAEATKLLSDGLQALRAKYAVPESFPTAVLAAAERAAAQPVVPGADRRDARDIEFVTLDPASSTDLDQAFAVARDGDDLVLSYAIADVGFFVERGGVIEAEAWKRGTTFYLPGDRVPLYPPMLCEGAASLLPDGDRPAVLLTVAVKPDGSPTLRSAEHAVIRSRAKLAYETVKSETVPLLDEFSARIIAAEDARGASRVEFPEQAVKVDASLSLAANLAVANAMAAAECGLFRVMAEPDQKAIGLLHHVGRALGVPWPKGMTLRDLNKTLDATNPKHVAFLMLARRLGGGATYAVFEPSVKPWHSAVAATYAHATAPLRRLADRYVLDLAVTLTAGANASADDLTKLAGLPDVMEKAESITSHMDHGVIDLVEAVTLRDRVGESFDATVVDNDRRSLKIQLDTPPVRATIGGESPHQPGDVIRVKLISADPTTGKIDFTV
jgi:exoribonuclease R